MNIECLQSMIIYFCCFVDLIPSFTTLASKFYIYTVPIVNILAPSNFMPKKLQSSKHYLDLHIWTPSYSKSVILVPQHSRNNFPFEYMTVMPLLPRKLRCIIRLISLLHKLNHLPQDKWSYNYIYKSKFLPYCMHDLVLYFPQVYFP